VIACCGVTPCFLIFALDVTQVTTVGGVQAHINMGTCGSRSSTDDHRDDGDRGVPVALNVYDLQARPDARATGTSINGVMGFGAYHSGVVLFNMEFSFGGDPTGQGTGTGVFVTAPRSCLPAPQFHREHLIGYLPAGTTQHQVMAVVNRIKNDWPMNSYHILRRNCNHFSDAFLLALDDAFLRPPGQAAQDGDRPAGEASATLPSARTKRRLVMPSYVNRAARVGSFMAPESIVRALTRGAPAATDNGSPASSTSGDRHEQQRASASPGAPAPAASGPSAKTLHPLPKTRQELERMTAKELKTAMFVHNVNWTGCLEKSDFIDAVMRHHANNP
jgi:hypothetical protein